MYQRFIGNLPKNAHTEKLLVPIRIAAEEFKKEHGTIICRDLLASPKAKEYEPKGGHAGICFEYVKNAARLTSEFIEQN